MPLFFTNTVFSSQNIGMQDYHFTSLLVPHKVLHIMLITETACTQITSNVYSLYTIGVVHLMDIKFGNLTNKHRLIGGLAKGYQRYFHSTF